MTLDPKNEVWPNNGSEINLWHDNLMGFMFLLDEVKDDSWWIDDWALKYIIIRIDTRSNAFLLFDQDNNRVSPDRVVAAIEEYEGKYKK